MPRKPGGKYKGKVGRMKGAATIALDLEQKRRKLYEANLAKLQERRQQDLLAENGMQSAEEEAQALKLAKIAQMFGSGKKGTLQKFWKNWRIGITNMRKEAALEERKTCWRMSCDFCAAVPVDAQNNHDVWEHNRPHLNQCKHWWAESQHRLELGPEKHPEAAKAQRPDVVNLYRQCLCCGADTGVPALGCRGWHELRESGFMNPTEAANIGKAARLEAGPQFMNKINSMMRPQSTPQLQTSKKENKMPMSIQDNWNNLRASTAPGRAREYDPTDIFVMNQKQIYEEERRGWSDDLSAMAGSPNTRVRSGCIGQTMNQTMNQTMYSHGRPLPPLMLTARTNESLLKTPLAPLTTGRGKPLDEATHWRTGQKSMLDTDMMKMYVVGVQ